MEKESKWSQEEAKDGTDEMVPGYTQPCPDKNGIEER